MLLAAAAAAAAARNQNSSTSSHGKTFSLAPERNETRRKNGGEINAWDRFALLQCSRTAYTLLRTTDCLLKRGPNSTEPVYLGEGGKEHEVYRRIR